MELFSNQEDLMSTSAVNATGRPRQHRPYTPRTSDAYTLMAVFEVKK
jgi:hypothetical protein